MKFKKIVYADNNASTQTHPEVVKKMIPYYSDYFGNASSIHTWGREARVAVDEAREKIAKIIGADANEIYFTSSGTESDNWAIKGVMELNPSKHIITSSIEHHAVLNVCKYMEKKGFSVSYIPVDKKGFINIEEFKKQIKDDTKLVSIMYANNEVGSIQPIKEIGEYIKNINLSREKEKKEKIYFHSDAVQALGKVEFNLKDLNVDLMSFSGHKINGPKGVGVLYIRKGTKIYPMLLGGHHEFAKRAGTENVPGIVGFAKAIEIAYKNIKTENEKMLNLKNKLYKGLTEKIKEVHLNGSLENSLSNTLNVSFNYIEGESIIMNLDMEGIGVSSGSACTSGSLESSHVLKAMGVDAVLAQGSIRFSLGIFNTEKDIKYILKKIPPIVEKLRKMSPLYKA
jgi:cysteine desulfurase